ncbi:hypothetical protein GCM10027416_26400 [Okibacterium endophyticum]
MSNKTVSDQPQTQTPETQVPYQVRFDFGASGLARIGRADVVVWVDALSGTGGSQAPDLAAVPPGSAVIAASLVNRSAAADWILEHQLSIGGRVAVAVVAAGRSDGFASNDMLAAGAVIDALVTRGIDFTSPEAAVACAAYEGLRNAVGHLYTASVEGKERVAAGERDAVKAAAAVDSSEVVEVLRGRRGAQRRPLS